MSAAPIPVVLDTDIGDDIDDALALSLALQSPELDIRAVVTVLQHGDRRADLAYKILELFDRTDIPVGVGAEQPLVAPGNNSIVRQTEALAANYSMPAGKRHNGIQLTIDTIMNSPQKITWLAYGPATNVGLVLRAEPRVREKIERIVLMNGIFFKPGLEYNTLRDPEASKIVYSSGIPVTAVGLDVTMQCRLSAQDLERIASAKLPTVHFLDQIIKIWQEGHADRRPVLHDPLAIAVTFQPRLVHTRTGRVDLELRGEPQLTYGMTLFREGANGSVTVAEGVESEQFVRLFMDRVTAPPRGAR